MTIAYILDDDPQNTQALLGIAINAFGLNPPSREDLDLVNKAANHLLSNTDSTFGMSKKPAFVTEMERQLGLSATVTHRTRRRSWLELFGFRAPRAVGA